MKNKSEFCDNLLSCPFCGSADILTDAYYDESTARCANCGATGPEGDYPTCQKLWNERAYSGRYPDARPDLVIRIPPISKEDEDALRAMGPNTGEIKIFDPDAHKKTMPGPFIADIDNTKYYAVDPETTSTEPDGSGDWVNLSAGKEHKPMPFGIEMFGDEELADKYSDKVDYIVGALADRFVSVGSVTLFDDSIGFGLIRDGKDRISYSILSEDSEVIIERVVKHWGEMS